MQYQSQSVWRIPIIALAICAISTGAAQTIVTQYQEDLSIFPNPEQGFYEYTDLNKLPTDIGRLREQGRSLIWGRVNLVNYRDTETLPEALLQQIDQGFGIARDQGMKVIVRAAYGSRGPGGDYRSFTDPPAQIIKGHLRQLEPVFAINADVIALFEAGFIGPWGEWHGTSIAQDYELGRDMLLHILVNTPADRMVVVRYPYLKQRIFALYSSGYAKVNAGNAYSQLPVARVGHHNDCFLSSKDDVGTYDRGGSTREQETAYLAAETLHTVYGGETCRLDSLNNCERALEELALLHGSYLNNAYHPEVLGKWQAQGCFDEIKRRLGARLVLQQSCISKTVPVGGFLTVELSLENRGFASLYNARKVQIVLRQQELGTQLVHELGLDPRLWKPGLPIAAQAIVTMPDNIATGSYAVYLNLPDPYASLQDDPRYSFRCANTGVWDAQTGYNKLVDGVTVVPDPAQKAQREGPGKRG
jgi:hypothetical protein